MSVTWAAWLKFDEGTGTTAADSSGNSRTATLVNGATWAADYPTVTNYGNCLSLDGTNDLATLANTANVSAFQLTGDFTIAFWHKSSSNQSSPIFQHCSRGAGNDVGWMCYWHTATAKMYFLVWTFAQNTIIGVNWTHDTSWNHWVFRRSGTTFEIFLNGVSQGTATSAIAIPLAGIHAEVSDDGDNGNVAAQPTAGKMSDVRLTMTALTNDQVHNLYWFNDPDPAGTINFSFTPTAVPLTNAAGDGAVAVQFSLAGTSQSVASGAGAAGLSFTPTGATANLSMGAIDFQFTLSGDGKTLAAGAGAAALSFTVTGDGTFQPAADGAISFVFTVAATSIPPATGAASFSFTVSGDGNLGGIGTGSLEFIFDPQGALTSLNSAQGQVDLVFTPQGIGAANALAAGSLTFVFSPQGVMSGNFPGAGAINLSLSLAGTGTSVFNVAGSIAITFFLGNFVRGAGECEITITAAARSLATYVDFLAVQRRLFQREDRRWRVEPLIVR